MREVCGEILFPSYDMYMYMYIWEFNNLDKPILRRDKEFLK